MLLMLAAYLWVRGGFAPNVSLLVLLLGLGLIEITACLPLLLPQLFARYEKAILLPESFLPMLLLFFSFTYARPYLFHGLSILKKTALACTIAFPAVVIACPPDKLLYIPPDVLAERVLFLGTVGYWYYIGMLLCIIASLVNIETVFASTYGTDRKKAKIELVGIGGILAVLIFYFSQGILFRTINLNLLPARSGILIVAALLIGYSRFSAGASSAPLNVKVSRYILYRSLTLLFIGIYFIFVAALGEGLRHMDIRFGRVLQVVISFLAGMLAVCVFLSERLRRRIKVFINKHFYAQKYEYRGQWLQLTKRLTLCRNLNDVNNVVITTFIDSFGFNSAAIYLRQKNENTFKLFLNYDMPGVAGELNISNDLASYFVGKDRVLNPDDGEYTPSEDEARFLAASRVGLAIPFIASEVIEGILICGNQIAPEIFNYEDYDLMKILARHATLSIVNFRLSEELAEAREMAAVAKVSSFIIHDLKNHAYSLSLLLENAEKHIGNPEFQEDMILAVKNTTLAMKNIIDRLKGIHEMNTLERRSVDLSLIAKETAEGISRISPDADICFTGEPVYAMIDAEEIKKVIVNIILNAVDASDGKGHVSVATGANGNRAFIRIADSGCGMTNDFIVTSLFKPFKSTKKTGLGIGLYQCRQIIEAHCGNIDVISEPDKGTTFTVLLPWQETSTEAGSSPA